MPRKFTTKTAGLTAAVRALRAPRRAACEQDRPGASVFPMTPAAAEALRLSRAEKRAEARTVQE